MQMAPKKIFWPTDFSENAAKALPYVTSLSEKYQTEVHVLYVLEPFAPFGTWYGDFDQSEIDKMHELEQQRAEKRLSEICESYLDGCPLYIRHTAIGDPAGEILKLIDKEKPDMVVMTTRGRKGRFAFGSVAEKVLKHSPVPVLTIPVHPEG
jgi:nucleotide-binding universal stress UspA family protein